MTIRLAQTDDLPFLEEMYRQVVVAMRRNGLFIWDDVYPAAFLAEDIAQKRLYVLDGQGDEITACYALCREHTEKDAVLWVHPDENALYLDRLAVHVEYARKGTGTKALHSALSLAKHQGAVALRLFVAESNLPAIAFYRKNGFCQREGLYEEVIDEALTLRFYGFETAV
ncbi:MAG: GNAT family N-acetyltransferase [Eubacteriales bacterium]|jgi:ribosomal protein S18 acetylase RimI-like enzyme